MSRMNQVMQVGNIGEDIVYYIEDYAYTYLKKQKGKEKNKYFLYGEKEESSTPLKVYIYGIAEKPKMEQTYFKDFYPLGFLKIKNDETFLITLKGQEQKMSGFYVFYAPNQAMQEYLVDHREEEQTQEKESNPRRQLEGEILPIKETIVPIRKVKNSRNKAIKNEQFLFPIGGILVACLLLLVLTSANGKKKIEIFKQVIAQNMIGITEENVEKEFIIEDKNINEQENYENTLVEEDVVKQNEETVNDSQEGIAEDNNVQESTEVIAQEQGVVENTAEEPVTEQASSEEINLEEYIVKDGDTLVAICKTKYGSLNKMQEICSINNIKNADYIAPGQKLYLP